MKRFLAILGSWRGGKIFWIRLFLATSAVLVQQRLLFSPDIAWSQISKQFSASLSAVMLLMIAAVLVTPEVLWVVLSAFDWVIGAVFLPSEEMCPPLDYRVARMYRKQLRFEEAVERYEFLTHYHPQALDAYLEGIDASFRGGMDDAAKAFLNRGLTALRDPRHRVTLQERYDFCLKAVQRERET